MKENDFIQRMNKFMFGMKKGDIFIIDCEIQKEIENSNYIKEFTELRCFLEDKRKYCFNFLKMI